MATGDKRFAAPTKRRQERSIDGEGRVTGGITFVNDVRCETALHVAFTLSTVAHADLVNVDTAPALALPGVVAALSGSDIGPIRLGRAIRDYPLLAVDRILFIGQRVAAVAAEDLATARRAAEMVEVDYRPLPGAFTGAVALSEGFPPLHPNYADYEGGLAERPNPNVQGVWELSHGEYAAAIDECESIIETTYRTPRLHSASLEPHACVVVPERETVHVYSTHKAPFELRRDLARISGRAEDEFTIHPVHIGGDFGSKGFPHLEGACYFLAMATGRPVRCVLSYYEVLTATGARHEAEFTMRTGLRGSQMHAHRTDALLDGGAFAALKAHPMGVVPAIRAPVEAYEVPHVYERCECRYTNSVPGAHVRSPGEFQAAFAGESHVDQIARALRVDPIDFRVANAKAPNFLRVLESLRLRVTEWQAETGKRSDTGIGVATCFRDAGGGTTTASCTARRDGRIEVRLATPDQGAGSYTLFRRLAATTLDVEEDAISVRPAATDQGLRDSGAGASRVSAVAGRATVTACQELLTKLGAKTEVNDAGADRRPHWIAKRLQELDLDEMVATGTWTIGWPPSDEFDLRSYGACAMEVHVDTETGEFEVLRAVLVVDTGVVVNPVAHRGQVEGGFIYGLSQATLENLVIDDGQVVTASLGDYRLMSAADVPPLEIVVLDSKDDAFSGMRSVGELSNVCAGPALANAIEEAVGIRISELPITSERVRAAYTSAVQTVSSRG